jgi:hypothetical protein
MTPTIDVLENMLDEIEANVSAPPRIMVSVLKGVRMVSSAMVPKTVIIPIKEFFTDN